MTAPEDCPVCDKPSLRDGECTSCGFTVPAPNVNELPDGDAKMIGLQAIAAIRAAGSDQGGEYSVSVPGVWDVKKGWLRRG